MKLSCVLLAYTLHCWHIRIVFFSAASVTEWASIFTCCRYVVLSGDSKNRKKKRAKKAADPLYYKKVTKVS